MLLNAPTLSTVVISDVPPELPESGTMYLFNKAKTKRWRNDKHKWQRRGSRLNEHHENLKVRISIWFRKDVTIFVQVRGTEVLNACYCRREEVSTFRRRAYWLLQPLIDARLEQLEDSRKEAQQALLSVSCVTKLSIGVSFSTYSASPAVESCDACRLYSRPSIRRCP